MRLSFWLLTSVVLFLCGSCSQPSQPAASERSWPVKVAKAELRDVPVFIDTIGHMSASQAVDVRPQVSGKIVNAIIYGGEEVKQGDLLYTIDPVPFELALKRAQATLAKDQAMLAYFKSRLERYSKLVKSEYVAPLTVEEYARDVSTQESQVLIDMDDVALAELNLEYSSVKAPMAGHLSLSVFDPGNLVSSSDTIPLIKILQIKPIQVNFSISQPEFQLVQKKFREESNHQFELFLPDNPQAFTGQIDALENSFNPQTGTIQLRGVIANEEGILWPGEYVKVRISLNVLHDAVVVPYAALQLGQKGHFVYILKEDHTVEMVPVKSGEHFGDWIVIEEGLEAGSIVVTEGQFNLRSGYRVFVADEQAQKVGQ